MIFIHTLRRYMLDPGIIHGEDNRQVFGAWLEVSEGMPYIPAKTTQLHNEGHDEWFAEQEAEGYRPFGWSRGVDE